MPLCSCELVAPSRILQRAMCLLCLVCRMLRTQIAGDLVRDRTNFFHFVGTNIWTITCAPAPFSTQYSGVAGAVVVSAGYAQPCHASPLHAVHVAV